MKGAQTFANYVKQDIREYAGNPLIEALPPILSEAAAIGLISNFPQPVDPKELTLEGATRTAFQLSSSASWWFLAIGFEQVKNLVRTIIRVTGIRSSKITADKLLGITLDPDVRRRVRIEPTLY